MKGRNVICAGRRHVFWLSLNDQAVNTSPYDRIGNVHAEACQESRPAGQALRHMRLAIHVAPQMGKKLERGEILLGAMQKRKASTQAM